MAECGKQVLLSAWNDCLVRVELGFGVAPGEAAPTAMEPPPPPDQKQVVVYGTSILHGAAAGRAGMVYSSQMQRYIRRPVVNLGFSGHGLMQQEVGDLLAEVPAQIFVLDCEYNMDEDDGDSAPGWPGSIVGNASTVACKSVRRAELDAHPQYHAVLAIVLLLTWLT